MPDYHVIWEIDIEADSPIEAARLAHRCQQKPTSAVTFDVIDDEGEPHRIDLQEVELYGQSSSITGGS